MRVKVSLYELLIFDKSRVFSDQSLHQPLVSATLARLLNGLELAVEYTGQRPTLGSRHLVHPQDLYRGR